MTQNSCLEKTIGSFVIDRFGLFLKIKSTRIVQNKRKYIQVPLY
jgi:50S ribosomal subunit-associated GTPase HflX